MSDNRAMDALKLYLDDDIDLDALEERIIPLAWDAEHEDQDLVGLILTEIAYINDGISNDALFRSRMSDMTAFRRQDITFSVNDGASEVQKHGFSANSSTVPVTYIQPQPTVDYQFVARLNS